MKACLHIDPTDRPTAKDLLEHPYFGDLDKVRLEKEIEELDDKVDDEDFSEDFAEELEDMLSGSNILPDLPDGK